MKYVILHLKCFTGLLRIWNVNGSHCKLWKIWWHYTILVFPQVQTNFMHPVANCMIERKIEWKKEKKKEMCSHKCNIISTKHYHETGSSDPIKFLCIQISSLKYERKHIWTVNSEQELLIHIRNFFFFSSLRCCH